MKHRHKLRHKLPKRATAHSRAAKREPLAALKNPRPAPGTAPLAPRFTPSPALDWDSEEIPPSEIRLNRGWYWAGAAIIAALALAWWLL